MASVRRRPGNDKDGQPYGWQVRYIDPATGKRPSATFKLKKDADAFKRKVEREIEDGLHVTAAGTQKMAAVVHAFMADQEERLNDGRIGYSHYARTELVCRTRIVPALGNLPAKDLTIEHVEKLYRDMVRGGITPLTGRSYLHVFRMVEQFARKRQWIKTQPVTDALSDLRGLPGGKIDTFTAEEVARLIDSAAGRGERGRFRGSGSREVMVTLGALCGMRMGEILGLRRGDVDLEARVIRVRQNLTAFREVKGPKTLAGTRDIHIPSRAADALRRWIEEYYIPNDQDLLLTTFSGKLLAHANVRREWLKLVERCGMPPRHFHALRHFHASWLLTHGMPVADVSKALGHSSHDMTLRVYTHAMLNAPEAATRLENIAALLPTAAKSAATPVTHSA